MKNPRKYTAFGDFTTKFIKGLDTCEDRRGVIDTPIEPKPAAVPAPPTIVPAQSENKAAAARAAKNGAVKKDKGCVAVGFFFP